MTRVLCAANPGMGHTVPMTTLAKQFRIAGCDVKVIATREHIVDLMRAHGLSTVALKEPGQDGRVRELLGLLGTYKPDVTVCDWDREFWFAMRLYRPKCTVSVLRCEQLKGYKRIHRLLPAAKFQFDGDVVDQVNARLRQLDPRATSLASLHELYIGDIIAIPSIPQLDPIPNAAEPIYSRTTFFHTGPLTLEEHQPVPEEVSDWIAAQRAERRIVVLVTFGTVVGREVYEEFVDAMADTAFAIVVTAPTPALQEQLRSRAASNIFVLGYSPLLTLIKLADVVIHHGGHATILLTLEAGKPALIIPTSEYDREDNAVRVERMGAGELLDQAMFREALNMETLAGKIERAVTDPAFKAGTAAMADIVRSYRAANGPEAVVRAALQRVLSGVRSPTAA